MFNEPLKIQKTQKKANRVTKFNNVLTLLFDFPSVEEGSLSKPEIYLAYSDRYWSVCVCAYDVTVFFISLLHTVCCFCLHRRVLRMEGSLCTRSFKYSENTVCEIKEVRSRMEEEKGSSSRTADFYGGVNHFTSSHIWL
jgi:hypothetical protein